MAMQSDTTHIVLPFCLDAWKSVVLLQCPLDAWGGCCKAL